MVSRGCVGRAFYKLDGFPKGAAVFGVERGQLAGIQATPWQTDTSISKSSWCYVEGQEFKSAHELICDLIDVVSKNGCMLLNVGPRADGRVAPEEERILLETGGWLALNGEALYGTRPYRYFGEGPTRAIEGQFSEGKRAGYTTGDLRFTRCGESVYVFVLVPPADGEVRIATLGGTAAVEPVEHVELVGGGPLAWRREAGALFVTLDATRLGRLGRLGRPSLPVVLKVRERRSLSGRETLLSGHRT